MDTNRLKRFAQAARKKLLDQVSSRLELILNTDSAELREKAAALSSLKQAINSSSKAQVIDKVAYTWFNRLMALRFMDVNDYQPLKLKIITPTEGFILPEILEVTNNGQLTADLPVNKQKINDLLDGKIPSNNAQNEIYKELLIGACNHLHSVFPFLFEKINDYTELLLPDDLTSEFSIIHDFVEGMQEKDCKEVEVIGWLYQFYISERNVELISSKNRYKKEDLAPASQLFTPKWVVQYMVDNTLGQLWAELNPETKVTESLEFYIKPPDVDGLNKRESQNIEEIKFFEPCVGSGHILSYAFDVFYKMYEEQGYNPSEIPELIITKNLYGVDIDERAAQLASFVLLMKGRQKHRGFLRSIEKNKIQPNISFFRDFEFDEKFKDASALGSLIKINPEEAISFKVEENSLFSARQEELKKLYFLLGQRYDIVVTNPPYISSNRMEAHLKLYVETNYPSAKHDLYSAFILRGFELCNLNGFTGFMTPFVWMFIPSFEQLRTDLLEKHFINNLIQLEYSGFDGATVPICTFTLRNSKTLNSESSFIKLSAFKGSKIQGPKTLEAIKNPDCGWFFRINEKEIKKIPGNRLGFWLSEKVIKAFDKELILDKFSAKAGIVTGNDLQFVRAWYEVPSVNISYNETQFNIDSETKWVPLSKGGEYRKYFGNNDYIINIKDLWTDGKTSNSVRRGDTNFYYKPAITWSSVTSSRTSFRYSNQRLFNTVAPAIFSTEHSALIIVLCFLNSKVPEHILPALNPTLHVLTSDVLALPYPLSEVNETEIKKIGELQIEIYKTEWNSRETSFDFKINQLLRTKNDLIEDNYQSFQSFWKDKVQLLYKNERFINRTFIDIFNLNKELDSNVSLKDLTVLKDETRIINEELFFSSEEVFAQFISYAVGCMFGRYSLDKQGLILASQGGTLEDYLKKVEKKKSELSFLPDNDNILPVLDDEWFEDDIVGRFYDFLKASFGKENFDKNLAFVEECLGRDVRKYFVKDFYKDHVKRYKKRPIYWMLSSPKGSFNVLIYMHRYTPDTLNQILNGYLVEYREKLKSRMEHLDHIIETGSPVEQTKAGKEKDKLKIVLIELEDYERDILYPLATERISIDLNDGVLVNYNKLGKAIQEVKGLNDKKTKNKVREFDWIDSSEII